MVYANFINGPSLLAVPLIIVQTLLQSSDTLPGFVL